MCVYSGWGRRGKGGGGLGVKSCERACCAAEKPLSPRTVLLLLRHEQVAQALREAIRGARVLRIQHLCNTRNLCGAARGGLRARARKQHVHGAAKLCGSRDSGERCARHSASGVLAKHEGARGAGADKKAAGGGAGCKGC